MKKLNDVYPIVSAIIKSKNIIMDDELLKDFIKVTYDLLELQVASGDLKEIHIINVGKLTPNMDMVHTSITNIEAAGIPNNKIKLYGKLQNCVRDHIKCEEILNNTKNRIKNVKTNPQI